MTLSEFINKKPPELRLGQWFYNCYLWRLHPQDNMQQATQLLYNTQDNLLAVGFINQIMQNYQWKELPDYD